MRPAIDRDMAARPHPRAAPGERRFSQGWLHAKLGLVVGMSALHGFFTKCQRDFAKDANRHSQRFYRIWNEIPARSHGLHRHPGRRQTFLNLFVTGGLQAHRFRATIHIVFSPKRFKGPRTRTSPHEGGIALDLSPEPNRPEPRCGPLGHPVPTNVNSPSNPLPGVPPMTVQAGLQAMKLQDLKAKKPNELLEFAEELEVENASSMRKQDMMFAILKELAERNVEITGDGVLEILQDGFGFLRSPESNYLAGPDDIYVSPSQIRRFGLRTGDTVEGPIRSPKDGERYFALLKVSTINFEDPDAGKHKVHFDNLTPLYPTKRFVAGARRSHHQGQDRSGDRHRGAARHGPARAHHRAAAHRQDRHPAEHRQGDRRQPPRLLPDRAPDRRAAGGSHRHAALGEGRGDLVHLRRARLAPRPGGRDGDREGETPGRAQARRRDPARLRSRVWAAPTTRSSPHRARC